MANTIRKASIIAMASCICGGAFSSYAASEGVKIEHLGTNNTLVRVTGEGKYLLIPVQESNDEAKVNVIVDGNLDRTFSVRLAKSKVDHMVPLDIERYKGKDVVLSVITHQDRSSVREAKDDAAWNNMTISDTFDTTNTEKYRPVYHHTPLYGWMNDPNGMYYKDGLWHLAYQWNPFGSKWQNMTWGESTSKDLVNWDRSIEPILEPDGLGMIFSGSSAIDKTGSAGFGKDAIVTMYTSADASQIQSLAHSIDGKTWEKYNGNPTLTLESEARDPNMFWDEATQQWMLVLAHALDHEILFFTSPDMKEWTFQGAFGKGLGAQGGVWECPDLFELPVAGTNDKKWVLLVNLNPGGIYGGSATQYFVGDFDGKTFTPELDSNGNVPTKWMDFGKDHYATVSFSDAPNDRRTVLGWMSNWQYAAEVPTDQFRSANTVPRDLTLFKGDDGMTYLASAPSPELDAIRGKVVTSVSGKGIGSKPSTFALPADGVCEIAADLDPMGAKTMTLTLSNKEGDKVVMVYDVAKKEISFDRTQSGVVNFSQDFPAVTYAPTFSKDGRLSLRMFIDTSSIELFEKDGRFVMTNLVFPNSPYTTLSVSSEGSNARLGSLKVYSIKVD